MPTERLQVEVSEKGSRVVKRNLEDVGQGARKAEGGVSLLKRSLGLIATTAVLAGIISMADGFTTLQNRLRVVTNSSEELVAVQSEILDIARATRSSLEATAEVYSRVALSAKDLGVSQREVLDFTRSLNQAVLLSGASGTEAQAGLIQLSQGLASGALRGDELRSVLEQLPVVADVIAKELGVTRGELREMGQEGKISAEIVLDAFANAREELQEKFGRTVPTVSQSVQVFRNELTALVGSLDQGLGGTAALSRGILLVAENLELLRGPLEFVQDVGTAVFEELRAALEPILPTLDEVQQVAGFVFGNLGLLVVALVRTVLESVDLIARGWGSLFRFLDDNFGEVIGGLTQLILEFVNTALGLVQGLINGIIRGVNAVRGKLGQPLLDEVELFQFDALKATFAGQEIGAKITEGLENSNLAGALDGVIDRFAEIRGRRAFEAGREGPQADLEQKGERAALTKEEKEAEERRRAVEELIASLRQEGEVLALVGRERRLASELIAIEGKIKGELVGDSRALVISLLEENAQLERNAGILEQIVADGGQFATLALELNQQFRQGAISLQEYTSNLDALRERQVQLQEESARTRDALISIFDSAGDSLLRFLQQGTQSFREFASSLVADIQRIIYQQLILNSIKGAIFSASGPVGGGAQLASAGLTAQAGASFTVGGVGGVDSQLVQFRATPGERVDVSTAGQQATAGPATGGGVTIINLFDPADVPKALAMVPEGQQFVLNTISLNANAVKESVLQ